MFQDLPDILTVPQVAQALNIGKKAAYELVNSGQLGAIHIGRNIKVPKPMLIRYVMVTAKKNLRM